MKWLSSWFRIRAARSQSCKFPTWDGNRFSNVVRQGSSTRGASPLAPALLYRLFSTIDASCRPVPKSRPFQANYLVDRKAYPQPDRFMVKLNDVGRHDAEADQLIDPPAPKGVDNQGAPSQQVGG